MPFIDLCEVVNRGVITPCLRCCANSVPVQLGPGPRGRRDPPAALASLADTFAGIIDREPAGPARRFVTAFRGGGRSPSLSLKAGGARRRGGRGAAESAVRRGVGSRSPLLRLKPGSQAEDQPRELWTGPWTVLPCRGEGYTQRSEVDPASWGRAGQTGGLQSLQPGPCLEYRGVSCPP